MSTLSPSKEFPLNAADQLAGLTVVEDQWFGFCAQVKPGQNLSFGTAAAMGLSTAAFTTSVWIKIEDQTSAMTFVANRGWQVLAGGQLLLAGGKAVGGLVPGQWHYVTWLGEGDNNLLFLDGSLIQTVAAGQSPWLSDDQAIDYVVSAGQVSFAHQHIYSHAMTPPEVMLDRASKLPAAARSFTQYYPLDFKVANVAQGEWAGYPDNNLFIVDSTINDLITQQLSISNLSDQVIHFEPFAAELPIETNHHLRLRVRHAVFTQPAESPQIASLNENQNWEIVRASEADPQDGCWSIYLRCSDALVLAASESLNFSFKYRSADGALGARSTRMLLSYQGLRFDHGGSIQGERNKRLDILNLSSNNAYIGRLNDSINEADKKVDELKEQIKNDLANMQSDNVSKATIDALNQRVTNLDNEQQNRFSLLDTRVDSLEASYPIRAYHDAPRTTVCNERGELNIYLYNRSQSNVVFAEGAQIKLRLPFGDKQSDLAQSHDENGTVEKVEINNTTVDGLAKRSNPTNGASVYEWSPAPNSELTQGNCIKFSLDNVVPNAVAGTSFIDISVKGVTRYQDATLTVAVTKLTPVEPAGLIVMFSGSEDEVPGGWAICDGSYDTPDLRDRFILACPKGVAPGTQGGAHSYSLNSSQLPTHTHTVNDGGHSHSVSDPGHSHKNGISVRTSSTDVDDDSLPIYARNSTTSQYNTSHKTTGISIQSSGANITLASAGSSSTVDNRPGYHTLYYIMKLADAALQQQRIDQGLTTNSVTPSSQAQNTVQSADNSPSVQAASKGRKRYVRRRVR